MQPLWILSVVLGAPIPQEASTLGDDEYSAQTTINFNKPKEVFWHEIVNLGSKNLDHSDLTLGRALDLQNYL